MLSQLLPLWVFASELAVEASAGFTAEATVRDLIEVELRSDSPKFNDLNELKDHTKTVEFQVRRRGAHPLGGAKRYALEIEGDTKNNGYYLVGKSINGNVKEMQMQVNFRAKDYRWSDYKEYEVFPGHIYTDLKTSMTSGIPNLIYNNLKLDLTIPATSLENAGTGRYFSEMTVRVSAI